MALDGALSAGAGGVLLGRAGYVATNWTFFQDHLGEGFQVWRGGLSASGALVGGILGAVVLCILRGTDPRPVLDALAPGAAVVTASAWLACLGAGCAWGKEVWPGQGLLWHLSADLPDLYGLSAPRVAVQALGAGWAGFSLVATLLASRWGRSFPLWLLLHSLGDFGLGFLRGDLSPVVLGLARLQMVDLVLLFIAAVLLLSPGWTRGRHYD
jgi:prolipoprotein diacylglyceryltransferase